MASYYLPKEDGTKIEVTIKEEGGKSYVWGVDTATRNGKKIGRVQDFADLEDVDGNLVTQPTIAPTANDEGELLDDHVISPVEDSERTNENGIKQTGKKLGLGDINGLFASLNERGQMTKGDLPSAGKFFSEALPTTKEGATQLGHGSLVTGPDGKPMEMETDVWNDETGRLEPASVPGVIGGKPESAEDGTSAKPDVADQIRQVRMHRNKRDQLEGFSDDEPFGGVDTTKGNGMTASRRAARAAFLDEGNKGYAAIRARDRAVGAFHQYDKGGMKIGDDIHMFKDGMSRDARFELSGNGIDSKEAAQSFLNKYVQGFGETAPTDSPTEPPASEQTATTLTPRNPSTAEKPSDPVIVDSTAPHPDTGRKPDAATEQSNKEYAATQFRFDPDKNMMVPVK